MRQSRAPICREQFPPFVELTPGHHSLCHFASGRPRVGRAMTDNHTRPAGIRAGPARCTSTSVAERSGVASAANAAARARVVRSVDGVSLDIHQGETLGLVGESGCGKTTFGRALLRLVEPTGGRVLFRDVDITALAPAALRRERRHMQMVFQDPYASLDPRMTVGQIIAEPIDTFRLARGAERRERIRELMATVGLSERFINRYPHEFSGGQQQRIGIARALAAHPGLHRRG